MASTLLERKNFELEFGFTELYKSHNESHPAIREAKCLEYQIPRILLDIQEDDLIPGGCHYGAVGFSTQIGGFLYYAWPDKIDQEIESHLSQPEYIHKLRDLKEFWSLEASAPKLRKRYTPDQIMALPTDDWENTSAIAYPLYRIAGAVPNFDKLLKLGIPGLEQLIGNHMKDTSPDSQPVYEAMLIALDTLRNVIRLYACRAVRVGEETRDPACRKNMALMHNALLSLLDGPPKHLLEAIELYWMYLLVSEVRNYGRIDVYLGDFYCKDIEEGCCTQEEADYYILKLWERMSKRRTITDGRIFVGGRGRRNEANADMAALSCIRATMTLKNPDPQLSLRFYQGMDPRLFDMAMDAIGQGCTYPILYNDDVVIKDVAAAFSLPYETAVNYVPYGCGEYVIDHLSFGTPSGVLNLLKALEANITGGRDLYDGKQLGIHTRSLADYQTFEEFYDAYKEQLVFHIKALAVQEKQEYDFAGETASFPFLSILYDDCILRGKGIFSGGIRYLGGTLECYGSINASDSLYSLKTLVFEQSKIDRTLLTEALTQNFESNPLMRRILKNAPKFGNDHTDCDNMAANLHRFVCQTIRSQAEAMGLHSYLAVIINNSANTSLGALTGASPDGRLSGRPMANAVNPQAEGDRSGITALLNSMLKLDTGIHAGAVYNLKLSRETFTSHPLQTRTMIQSYFERGGSQLMITVAGRKELEEARIHPELYPSLLVRVGGFSARFVELPPLVQEEILSRTCY